MRDCLNFLYSISFPFSLVFQGLESRKGLIMTYKYCKVWGWLGVAWAVSSLEAPSWALGSLSRPPMLGIPLGEGPPEAVPSVRCALCAERDANDAISMR